MSETTTKIEIGGVPLTSPGEGNQRLSMMLWGGAGTGKTSLAATAPGESLLINLDPDGPASIGAATGVHVLDLSNEGASRVAEQGFKEDAFSIKKTLVDNPQLRTVILDSVTSFAERSTEHGATKPGGSMKALSGLPSMKGYQFRNFYVGKMVRNMLRLTGELNRNIIFVAHEDVPEKNDDGVVLQISIMLGGKLPETTTLQISEVWAMRDDGKNRKIAVRPQGLRKPMKTRMFDVSKGSEFVWKFNPTTWEGQTINDFYNEWRANDGRKIPVPT